MENVFRNCGKYCIRFEMCILNNFFQSICIDGRVWVVVPALKCSKLGWISYIQFDLSQVWTQRHVSPNIW